VESRNKRVSAFAVFSLFGIVIFAGYTGYAQNGFNREEQVMKAFSANSPRPLNASRNTSDEIPALRNRNSNHFRNPDGSISAYFATVSVHYFDGEKWLNIDNTIETAAFSDAIHPFVNEQNAFTTKFPSNPLSEQQRQVIAASNFTKEYCPLVLSIPAGTISHR